MTSVLVAFSIQKISYLQTNKDLTSLISDFTTQGIQDFRSVGPLVWCRVAVGQFAWGIIVVLNHYQLVRAEF